MKNSYDADADNIKISFEKSGKKYSEIRISDDGDGMTIKDVVEKWMRIGTDNKIKETKTKKGRRKLGEKGIGRFSVERLSEKTLMRTKIEGTTFWIEIFIDWRDYENDGDFTKITHDVRRTPGVAEEHGTELILTELHDNWTCNQIKELKAELELIKPINFSKNSTLGLRFPGDEVNISLVASECETSGSSIETDFMNRRNAHFYGEICADKTAKINIKIDKKIAPLEKDVFEEFKYGPDDEIDVSCGPLKFEIFIFLKKAGYHEDISISKIKDVLKEYSGVKIYRDGFRVLPFGNPEDDWLSLNSARGASPEFRLVTSNTIGIVHITRDENPSLQDVLSRENMYYTPEFKAMKNFINLAFHNFEKLQLRAREEKKKKQNQKKEASVKTANKQIKALKKTIECFQETVKTLKQTNETGKQKNLISSVLELTGIISEKADQTIESIEIAQKEVIKTDEFSKREMQVYRNIATLGISAAMFGHEAANHLYTARRTASEIGYKLDETDLNIESIKTDFKVLKKKIESSSEKADFFRSYLEREKQYMKTQFDIKETLTEVINQHKNVFSSINISLTVIDYSEDDYRIYGYKGDFVAIFTNMMTNAYKALNRKEHINKYLTFEMRKNENEILIISKNNGDPIEEENRDKIFDPMFTTYCEGTGLGLTIVKDTLAEYAGDISLDHFSYPETMFRIVIPRDNNETK